MNIMCSRKSRQLWSVSLFQYIHNFSRGEDKYYTSIYSQPNTQKVVTSTRLPHLWQEACSCGFVSKPYIPAYFYKNTYTIPKYTLEEKVFFFFIKVNIFCSSKTFGFCWGKYYFHVQTEEYLFLNYSQTRLNY